MKAKYLFLLLPIMISCKSSKSSLYEFDSSTLVENKINLADIADDITYIPIDSCFPIGPIYTFKFTDNSIYLSTREEGIIVLNRDGKIEREIGKKGRGPGEYFLHSRFTVDDRTETVYVMDIDNKVKVYSKKGNFIRSFSLPECEDGFRFSKIDFYKSNLFVSQFFNMGHAEYNWIIIDTLGNVIKYKKNSVPTFPGDCGARGGTYFCENNIYYWDYYNDTVFSISPDLTYQASFLFSTGDHRWPRSRVNSERFNLYMSPSILFETTRFLVIEYYYNNKEGLVLIDKKSKKTFLTYLKSEKGSTNSSGGIVNNLDGGIMFQPQSYFVENNREYMISFVEPSSLKVHISSNQFIDVAPKYPEKKKELVKLANRLKDTDNPVFVMVSLKK